MVIVENTGAIEKRKGEFFHILNRQPVITSFWFQKGSYYLAMTVQELSYSGQASLELVTFLPRLLLGAEMCVYIPLHLNLIIIYVRLKCRI